jgi:ribosomal protein S18 acetylase RimI-like enzyme
LIASVDITFRPITNDDMPFLQALYGTTREDELALVDWTREEKDNFIAFQFNAQHTHYQKNYVDAEFSIILLDGQPAGRIYVDRREDEHRIVDIALLPEQRGQGIGGRIMQDLLDEASAAGKMVRIHVEHNNPAMHLYERLGFKEIGDTEVYYLMEWKPQEL